MQTEFRGTSNLWYGSDSAVVEIRDAVEDAKNGKDLLNRIQKMKLLRKFTLDRRTKSTSAKGTDCWGNVVTSKSSAKGKTDRRKGLEMTSLLLVSVFRKLA